MIHKDDIEILEKMWAIRDWKNENKEEDGCFWTEHRINYSPVGWWGWHHLDRLPKWLKVEKMSYWEKSKPCEIA